MAITPLDIRKMTFPQKLRGYDPREVESFLVLAAEELTARLGDVERLQQENREYRRRLEEAHQRQQELQEAMLHAQRLSQEITENAKKEAGLLIKEAEIAADSMVMQAIEQAQRIEAKIVELRAQRRELQLKVRNTLDHYRQLVDEDIEDERTTAMIRTMPRQRAS
jgi:cell division initiation protein